MRVEFVDARPEHVPPLVGNMRAHDREEFEVAGAEPVGSIISTMARSAMAKVALVDGEAACLWGVKEDSVVGGGHIWLVTTPLVERHPRTFVRRSREAVDCAMNEHPLLWGLVDSRYAVSRRWMEWMGFEAVSEVVFRDIPLVRYERRAAWA